MNRTRTSKNAKRLLVWLLLLTMVFGLLPMAAFADETVVEPIVSEEPVQELEHSSEPTEAPSEPTQEPETIPEPEHPGNAAVTIEGDEEQPEDDADAEDEITTLSTDPIEGFDYSIVMVDCGRKYYSVESINSIISSAASVGMHYVMLAVGNDGLRFILDDMSLSFNGTDYTSEKVKKAIHAGNQDYDTRKGYNPGDKEELTEADMVKIMEHANKVGVQIIPLINTPGHMDAILYAMGSGTDALNAVSNPAAFSTSKTTIDINNADAVAFTQALLQKYITYFANKGCTLFNMGADEYANDINDTPHFSNLITSGGYSKYISHVDKVAGMIENAGMRPMAFNDGIYYNNNSAADNLRKSILVCYWSPGWSGYNLASASSLRSKGFELINTNGSYYWVVGKNNAQCDANKASGFDKTVFPTWDGANWGTETIADPSGAMFCVWSDFPAAMEDTTVVDNVTGVIQAFGGTLPATDTPTAHTNLDSGSTGGTTEPEKPDPTTPPTPEPSTDPANKTINLKVGDTATETVDGSYADVTTDDSNIAKVDPKVSDKPGTGTYTKVSKGEGTFFVSKSSAVTAEPPVTLTFENAGNGEYYIKNGNGYVYPKWTWNWGSGSIYSIESGKEKVAVNTSGKDGGYTISCSYTGSLFGSTYTAYLSYDNNGNLTAQSSAVKLYLYTKTDPEKQTTITFTGVKPGTTTCQIGDTLYEIIVDYKQETVNAFVGGTKTVEGVSGELDTAELNTGVAKVTLAGNVLTITGVGEGTTSVIVGNTKYTIVVTKEDLKKVTPLPLEYWITNGRISSVNGVTSETRTNLKNETYEVYFTNILATVDSIASAEGINVLKNIAPDTTEYENRDVYYWHCRMLDTTKANSSSSGTERQTNDGADDDTSSGVGFTKIRYYNGAWAVYTENFEWVAVESKHQLVAYYREHIKVSDEIESYAADWGNRGDGSKGGWIDTSKYCTLSMQVVYEDNTTNPISTSAADLKSKTIVYGYWSNEGGRGIGTVMLDGKEYEIYKVTSETGAATVSFSGFNATVANFTWDNNETTVWEGDATDSVTIHNPSKGYSTDGANANLCWDENKEAILLRVYVRAKATPDTLTVHYIDKTDPANLNEFYSYNITVGKGVKFSEDFKRTNNGTLEGNTVVNINNVTQTVLYDLKQMKEIGAQYRYASFVFVDASREASGERAGMDVYLYYTFNRNRTFVVDFGIPLVITPAALNAELAKANITNVDVSSTSYADITAEPRTWNINYKLKTTLDKSDTFSAYYKGTKVNDKGETVSDEAPYTIEIIPASSVYYEESFVTFTGGKNTAVAAQWTDDSDGTAKTANQQLSALGSGAIYGNDEAYNKSTKFSLGNAKKVTITNDMLNGWTSDSAWPTATFTFEGTGFDVISLTSNTTAAIAVNLVGTTANGEQVSKKYMVNTYYGYKYNDTTQKWEIDKSSTDTLYQIPVIAVKGLDYGKYTVTIMPFYNAAFDMQGKNTNDFWLDAIRVYDPLGKDYTRYTADKEGYPQYIKLRDKVADGEAAADKDVLFIDGAGNAKVEKYKNYGPNNEVYLAKDQAISFKLPANGDITSIQIGAKSPNASDTVKPTMSVKINANTPASKEIGTATEMYYTISKSGADAQLVTITNTGNAILSLTNIKITYSKQSTTELAALSEGDEQAAVAAVRALYAAPVQPEPTEPTEPEQPDVPQSFEPERFETSWSRNVRKGSRAVLTVKASTDVDAIAVNGVTVTQFKTRTERIGYGWNAKRVTYREFSYMMTANEVGTINIPVVAVSNDLGSSAAYDSTLTVKPSSPIRDWIGGLFGRWF